MDDVELHSELYICVIELLLFSSRFVKCSWPSGPRRQIKALVSQEAWVQTPPNTNFLRFATPILLFPIPHPTSSFSFLFVCFFFPSFSLFFFNFCRVNTLSRTDTLSSFSQEEKRSVTATQDEG